MGKKNRKTSVCLQIDKEVWIKAKKKCIDLGVKYSFYVEDLIKNDVNVLWFKNENTFE